MNFKKKKTKKDPKIDGIDTDPEFLAFKEDFEKEDHNMETPEMFLDSIEKKEKQAKDKATAWGRKGRKAKNSSRKIRLSSKKRDKERQKAKEEEKRKRKEAQKAEIQAKKKGNVDSEICYLANAFGPRSSSAITNLK